MTTATKSHARKLLLPIAAIVLFALSPAAQVAEPAPKALTSVSAASYRAGIGLAPNSIVSAFGEGFTNVTAVAEFQPLPTELGGVVLTITDIEGNVRRAPLFFVSPTQVNYLMPSGTVPGVALAALTRNGREIAVNNVPVTVFSPAIFTANASGAGAPAGFAARFTPDGGRFDTPLFDLVTLEPAPIDLGAPGDKVFLLLFGTGMRIVSPESLATVGEEEVEIVGPVPQGQFAGLDQINLGPLPRSLAGQGEVSVRIAIAERRTNNVNVRFD